MKLKRILKGLRLITMLLAVSTGLVACGNSSTQSYDEEIEKEIARMIAEGELIDVAAAEAFDQAAMDLIESHDVGDLFEDDKSEAVEEEIVKERSVPVFVQSDGPDTIVVDDYTYYKIGTQYQPGEYVIVAEEGKSYYYCVIMDDEEHSIVINGGSETQEVFDTLEGQYITFIDGKIYPIDQAPEVKKTDDGAYPEGIYKVGVQIPAGEYVAKGDGVSLETMSDLSGSYESKLGYTSSQRSAIIKVEEGQYIKSVWGDIYPIEKTADLKPANGIYEDGSYKVGFHMPEGTYVLKADAEAAYAQIYNDSYQTRREDELIIAEPETTFTVKDGQYVIIIGGEAVAK